MLAAEGVLVKCRIVTGTTAVLAVACAVVAPGAWTAKGETEQPQTLRLAPHPPQVRVVPAAKHDTSRPLRDITPVFPSRRPQERENRAAARKEVAVPPLGADPVL